MTDNLAGCLQAKARNQIIKKLIQYQIVQLYAQHKIEEALVKYASATDANRAEVGVVWDEFWAFTLEVWKPVQEMAWVRT